jgi:hypothetical protein
MSRAPADRGAVTATAILSGRKVIRMLGDAGDRDSPGAESTRLRRGWQATLGRDPVRAPRDRESRRAQVPNGVLAGLAVLMLVSCSDSSPPDTRPSATGSGPAATLTSASAAGSPSRSTTADPAGAEAAYRAFWPVLTTFAREPEARWRSVLGRVAAEPQVGLTIALTLEQRRNGITVYGRPTPRAPKVTIGAGGQATVQDCADFSRTGQADARTGQRRTVGIARNPVLVTLRQGEDGRWRVVEVRYPGGRC